MNFQADWSSRRSQFLAPMQYSIGNFYTDAQKTEMKDAFGEDLFHNLHLIPELLKKNLADTLPTNQESVFEGSRQPPSMGSDYSRLSGITSFFTSMMSALSGAMFRRARSPEAGDAAWQHANGDYKNGLDPAGEANVGMSECKTAAAACEDKLNKVRQLLTNKTTNRYISRRPRRVFVDPTSVEEQFEDAFSPEDFIGLANDTIIEYFSPLQYQEQEYYEVDTPKIWLETAPAAEQVPLTVPENVQKQQEPAGNENNPTQVVTSCEDKLLKLKALLQNKRNARTKELVPETPIEVVPMRQTKSIPIAKSKDKKYKNPHRLCVGKRQKARMKQDIQEDMMFAEEINLDESSVENSPSFHSLEKTSDSSFDTPQEYFDEISGRFRSMSASSEDSYQIVFTDIPKRVRSTSECDSEDSFIVFEDSPDSCYTSNDVFGDSDTDSSDSESDSGCDNMRLPQCLSRTISNLTDASLYDEVDSSRIVPDVSDINSGLLLDDRKKASKKNFPAKKVRFSEAAPRVHVMRVWAFAARQARPGHWERYARDRERFQRRIADVDMAVSWVLKPQHRARVMFQRFMPWWNAQKRKELAEKKEKEERMKKEALEKELAGDDNDTDTRLNNDAKTDPTDVSEASKSEDVINKVKSSVEINEVSKSEENPNSESTEVPSDNTQKGSDKFRSDVEKSAVTKYNDCMVISNYNSGAKCDEANYEVLDKVRSDADIIRNDLDVKYGSPKTIEFVASI